jgi:1-acyl-sn-glycerol-3-phosphate acyltransferase
MLRRLIAKRILGVVFVTRGGDSADDPLQGVRDALAVGWSIILFPEGTRSLTGEIAPFRSGLYRLSQEFPGVRLIPVYLSGFMRAMPKGRFLPVPINCDVSFGDPLSGTSALPKDEFLAVARSAVINLQHCVQG